MHVTQIFLIFAPSKAKTTLGLFLCSCSNGHIFKHFIYFMIMNKLMKMLAMALLFTSMCACSSDDVANVHSSQVENSWVQLSFFQSSMEKYEGDVSQAKSARLSDDGERSLLTRADDDVAKGATIANLKACFSRLDIEVIPVGQTNAKTYVFHQKKSDEDFGKLSLRLPIGDYKIVAVASNATEQVDITSSSLVTFPGDFPTDMAYVYKEFSVKSGANTVSCDMKRSVSKLSFVSTDVITSDISKIELVYVGKISNSLNPSTGLGVLGDVETKTMTKTYTSFAKPDGKLDRVSLNSFFLLPSESVTIQTDIKIYNTKGTVIKSLHFDEVILKRNHATTYTGPMFTSGSAFEFVFASENLTSAGADKTFDDAGNVK